MYNCIGILVLAQSWVNNTSILYYHAYVSWLEPFSYNKINFEVASTGQEAWKLKTMAAYMVEEENVQGKSI